MTFEFKIRDERDDLIGIDEGIIECSKESDSSLDSTIVVGVLKTYC